MNENVFCGELQKALREIDGVWTERHHTMPVAARGIRYRFKTPYDFYAVVDGIHVAFEAKQIRPNRGLYISDCPPHQMEALEEIEKAGGLGFYVIHCWHIIPRENNIAVFVRPSVMRGMLDGAKKVGLKKFDPLGLSMMGPHIIRAHGRWQVGSIIERVCKERELYDQSVLTGSL